MSAARRFAVPVASGALLVAACSLLVGACSDDDGGGGTSSGTTSGATPVPEGGMVSEGSAPDAASITPRPDLCQGLTRGGEVVQELALVSDPPPPLGGTIPPGTYDLAEMNAYVTAPSQDGGADAGESESPPTALTGRAAQATIVVTQFEMRFVEARGPVDALGPETTRAVLYRVDGTNVLATNVCPSTAGPAPFGFSAVGTGFAIFTDATHRELYTKR